jgi:predicted dehydrogenase
MNLTPEQEAIGRRNFLKALAGTPALAALGGAVMLRGPIKGGPVRLGWIGVGGQGRVLLRHADPGYGEVRAMADINPTSLAAADKVLEETKRPPARHYTDWKEMLQKEDLEAIVIGLPLWLHADVTVACLEAGKHVLCEKMMAFDQASCQRMLEAERKSGRLLEIGYQRNYNPVYEAAYDGVVRSGQLGDVFHARLTWHRNGNWRRKGAPPTPDFDPSRWGYPTFEHLLNWRLYWRYSKGLFAELASHQVNVSNWFFGAVPEAVTGSGGVYRYTDGREVYDHVYATFEYPLGRTATFSSIESNAFEEHYEVFYGTKATLLLKNEADAYLFPEGGAGEPAATALEVTKKSGPALDASESRPASATGGGSTLGMPAERVSATKYEVARFCSAVRVGTPLACGAERALHSARACLLANESVEKKARLTL